jgi:hypothetical protein
LSILAKIIGKVIPGFTFPDNITFGGVIEFSEKRQNLNLGEILTHGINSFSDKLDAKNKGANLIFHHNQRLYYFTTLSYISA